MQSSEKTQARKFNPAQIQVSLLETLWQTAQLMTRFIDHHQSVRYSHMADKEIVLRAFAQLSAKMMADPFHIWRNQAHPWREYLALWQSTMFRMLGHPSNPVILPKSSDKRFRHAHWENYFLFDYIKQSYLLTSRYLHSIVGNVEGLDEDTRKKIDFYTRQYIDAIAPSNFVLTNPQVLDETVRTGGMNLVHGLKNLLNDLERGGGRALRIKMTDPDAFQLGENIAASKGSVIYQNELMQLLQYNPTTATVHSRPLLIIPPWINKYYILDLREKNSFIKWAIDHGHTVFVISWVNPDAKLSHKNFEDYLLEGPLAALDAIETVTGESTVNALGYCLGGTLLATLLAYLAEKKRVNIVSATFLTTLLDFTDPGEMSVFTDEKTLAALESRMHRQGYFDTHEMAHAFNLLRSNDLIWTFVVNNYLLGKQPLPFDLLHWNSDSTRLPATMHSFYLRNMYRENLLTVPGGMHLNDVPINLGKVNVPSYFFSTAEDHIAPWKSVYAGTRLFSGPVRFVLGDAGHIAGVVNPPRADNKYGYWTKMKLPYDPEEWLAQAKYHKSSWWNDWLRWIEPHAGNECPSRMPGNGRLKPIEAAPGSYVRHRFDVSK